MKRNNHAEFYYLVAAYRAGYTDSDKTEAKKEAEAIWTQLKDDYILGLFCFVLLLIIRDTYCLFVFRLYFCWYLKQDQEDFLCLIVVWK